MQNFQALGAQTPKTAPPFADLWLHACMADF